MNHNINNINDLLEMLDAKVELAAFDWMYSEDLKLRLLYKMNYLMKI